ncbi:MAG: FIVAR domain-containing protein, partial [Clostridia bacterium]|nr:FIVAR domain-containing protein [Clostridia bacterium]
MSHKLKKTLSLLLTLAMVFTMIPAITIAFTEKAHAYGTYSKPYSTEYYYSSSQTFIRALAAGYDGDSLNTVKSQLTNAGWTPCSNFLDMMQSWSGTKNVGVGYRTTTDPTKAITDISFFDSDDAHGNYTYHNNQGDWPGNHTGTGYVNGTAYTGVPDASTGIVFFRCGTSPLEDYSVDHATDFLKGKSGCGYEYLCATMDRSAGAPIIAVDCFSGTSSGWTMASCLSRGCNSGAHSSAQSHSTRYVGYKRLTTTVNSNTLRSNYTTALGRYNESNYSAKYTSASRTALQNALTNAEGVLSDLNDGFTTTTQDTINSYATALSNAVSGLTLNTYTVTFKGYTSGTTTGTLKTQTVSYGGSATPPGVSTTYDSANHYTFSSWNGSYTGVTSTRTINANYATSAHSYSSQVTNNATCTTAGSTKYTCSCGYNYTDNTTPSALNHSFTSQTTTSTYLKSAATCTAKAVYYYKCSRCDAKGTTTYEYGDPLGHNYTGDYVNQSAGKHYRKCERFAACGTYGMGTTQNATENCSGGTATCTDKPVCTKCSTAYGSTLGHDWDYANAVFNWNGYACPNATVTCLRDNGHSKQATTTVTSAVTTQPTCTAAGVRTYTASFTAGGNTYTSQQTETLSATGVHNYSAATVKDEALKSEATCTASAVYYYSCAVCGAVEADDAHTFTNGDPIAH